MRKILFQKGKGRSFLGACHVAILGGGKLQLHSFII